MVWIKRWKDEVQHPPIRPGIWRRRAGGFLVTCQITDETGRRRFTMRTLPRETKVEGAQRELDELRADRREALSGSRKPSRTLFAKFAASVFRSKVRARDIRSAKGVEKWADALELHLLPAFGAIRCDRFRHADVAAWRNILAERVAAPARIYDRSTREWKRNREHLSPRTVNGWFSILRVLTKRMSVELDLDRDPCIGLANFSTLEHPTYTDERPNALTAAEVPRFMTKLRELYPQHYAFAVLGFATGLRPSTLRPLRRKGAERDLDLAAGILRVRRSNSLGDKVSGSTKTGKHQRIHLPRELVEVLREQVAHVEAREALPLEDAERLPASDLLFPSTEGRFRSRSSLDKPFRVVSDAIGLPHAITPRAMRRTYNDLARLAGVTDVVTRSISGHATEGMQHHYSTAQAEEQRAGLAKVVSLFAAKGAKAG